MKEKFSSDDLQEFLQSRNKVINKEEASEIFKFLKLMASLSVRHFQQSRKNQLPICHA